MVLPLPLFFFCEGENCGHMVKYTYLGQMKHTTPEDRRYCGHQCHLDNKVVIVYGYEALLDKIKNFPRIRK